MTAPTTTTRTVFCHILPDLLPHMSDRAVCAVIATGDPDASAMATAHFITTHPEYIQAMFQYAWAWALWTSIPQSERRRTYHTWVLESILRSPTHTYEDITTRLSVSSKRLDNATPLMCAMRRYRPDAHAQFLSDWDTLSHLLSDALASSVGSTVDAGTTNRGGRWGEEENVHNDVTIEFPCVSRFTSLLHQSIMTLMRRVSLKNTGNSERGESRGTHLLMSLMAK